MVGPLFPYMKNLLYRFKASVFNSLIEIGAENDPEFYVVQIGAHDGKSGDPIYDKIIKYKLRGVLVEPVKYLYDRLVETHKERRGLHLINAAVSTSSGHKNMYRLRETDDGLPPWYDQLASFDPAFITKLREEIPNAQDYLITELVRCVTFEELLEEAQVRKIGLLQIDVEGYDFEIIKMINFHIVKPAVIRYENKHLTKLDQLSCSSLLQNNGYRVVEFGEDTFAFFGGTVFYIAIGLRLCRKFFSWLGRRITS
jgi:FkbM family methyltransferase